MEGLKKQPSSLDIRLKRLGEMYDVDLRNEFIFHPLRSAFVLGLSVFLRAATFRNKRWETKS